jgi:predicted Zn-dependent protease
MKAKLASLIIASLVALGLVGVLLWKGVPLLFAGAVRLVPVSWEQRLGRAVAESFSRGAAACDDPQLREDIDEIVKRLNAALPSHPYSFRVQIVKSPDVNALAAPGGYLVVFSGLLDRLDGPEQLAAILAHEMQHVIQRHSTKSLTRSLGLQLLLALVIGDPGGLSGIAGSLGMLHLMRGDERSADEAGMDNLIAAQIDPREMIEAFKKLGGGDPREPNVERALKYLSTHPPVPERIEYLSARANGWKGVEKPFPFKLSRACAAAR